MAITSAGFAKLRAQSNNSKVWWNISGTVRATDENSLYVTTSSGLITVKFTSTTRIWKGEDGVSVKAIRQGDEVSIRGRKDVDGSLIPFEVWVNIAGLDGIIAKIEGPVIEVDVVRNDSVDEVRRVRLTGKTLSSENIPLKYEHLQVGRVVRVIGTALEDGTIQAYRVMVYVNGRPVDSFGRRYAGPVRREKEQDSR